MRKLTILASIISLSGLILASIAFADSATLAKDNDNLWERTYGNQLYGSAEAAVLAQDGGIFVAGSVSPEKNNNDNMNMLLMRLDAKGNILWQRAYDQGGYDSAWGLVRANDGGVYLCGRADTKEGKSVDMYLVRVDAEGDTLWERTYGGDQSDFCHSMVLTKDGGVYLVGITITGAFENQDIYAVRIDAKGDMLWERRIESKGYDTAQSAALAKDGSLFIGGATDSKGNGKSDMYLIRLDTKGNVLWDHTYGGKHEEWMGSIFVSKSGGLFLTGSTSSQSDGEQDDMYVVRVDDQGKLLWEQSYEGEPYRYEGVLGTVEAEDGSVYLAGYDAVNDRIEGSNVVLRRIDAQGKLLWTKSYGGNSGGGTLAYSVIIDKDGSLFLAGSTYAHCNGEEVVYVLRVDTDGNLGKNNRIDWKALPRC